MKAIRVQKGVQYNYSKMASEMNEIYGYGINEPVFCDLVEDNEDIREIAKEIRTSLYCADIKGAEFYDAILIGNEVGIEKAVKEDGFLIDFSKLKYYGKIKPIENEKTSDMER